jgi:hypothetical protein
MSKRRRREHSYSPSSPYGHYADEFEPDIIVRREPAPGIAAVLSVLIPGLGQVYNGNILAGGFWFLGTACAYSAVLLPGFLVHALCVFSAYRGAEDD